MKIQIESTATDRETLRILAEHVCDYMQDFPIGTVRPVPYSWGSVSCLIHRTANGTIVVRHDDRSPDGLI